MTKDYEAGIDDVNGVTILKEARQERRYWGIVRSGKGRLKVERGIETVDIKVRVEVDMVEELRQVAERLGVPMAKIVRESIVGRLKELQNNI